MLVMARLACTVDKGVVRYAGHTVQTPEDRVHLLLKHVAATGKSKWEASPPVLPPRRVKKTQSAALLINFYLPVATSGIKDAEMCRSCYFWYDVINRPDIVSIAPDGFVEVARV